MTASFIQMEQVAVKGINWKGMNTAGPSPHDKNDYYKTEPIKETDDNGMDHIVEKL